ncbi:MAG: 3-phosphoshikimate 1-carboxyvinyltransferase [Clostridia bacterium]|nr:3-phosphoshikimate 1-carboxyvinyltransferase [Clostridia bacterium]
MRVEIKKSTASGKIAAPPSKSAAHRALICAALSEGSTIYGLKYSGDVEATLSCLEGLGAKVERSFDSVSIGGLDPRNIEKCTIDCGESGSTLRFLLPLCLISGEEVTLRGTEKLMSRPLDAYEKLCREKGFLYKAGASSLVVAGKLTAGDYDVSMSKSSQFVTGLLLALQTLEGDSTIKITGDAESLSYVDVTMSVMRDFGASVGKIDGGYEVRGKTKFRSLSYDVEGDFSNAAFLDSFNFVGGSVRVTGLSDMTSQGDRVYPELFRCIAEGVPVDLSDCPDLAPVMFALAAYRGEGRFTGTRRLKYKESDRAAAMKYELSAFGVRLDEFENEVIISGKLRAPDRVHSSHNDHRIAMALSVLCSVTGGVIDGAEAVAKSYPSFFEDVSSLGIEVKKNDA